MKWIWKIFGAGVVILVCASACSPAAPKAHSLAAPAAPGTVLWTFPTQGEVWSSPAAADGVVYFGSDDHFVYAVDLQTHALKWNFETSDIVRSRPAIASGMVYFSSDDGYLYAVNAKSGKQIWKLDMGRPLVHRKPIPESWDYMQSSPAVAAGLVYVGTSNPNFYAVDAKTGKVKWQTKVGVYVRDTPAVANGMVYVGDWIGDLWAFDALTGAAKWTVHTYGSVVPSPTIVDGMIYIGSKFPCVYAFVAQTGEQKWCYKYSDNASWVESTAAVTDGVVYVGSSDLGMVNAIDAATGTLKWDFKAKGDPWSSPAVADGVVYIGSTGGGLYALDAVNGAQLWTVGTEKPLKTVDVRFDSGVVSSPLVLDGVVYFGSLDGKLYAVSAGKPAVPSSPAAAASAEPASTATTAAALEEMKMNINWTFAAGKAIWGNATVEDGVVYFGSDDTNLYAVDGKTGSLAWKFTSQGIIRSKPAITAGKVIFSSDDGGVYALDLKNGSQIWRTDIGNKIDIDIRENLGTSTDPSGYDYLQSSPVAVGDQVFVGSLDGKVYALSADTGSINWAFQTGDKVRATPAEDKGVIYIGSWDKNLYALDEKTGKVIWSSPIEGQVQSTALLANGLVYCASRKAAVFALDQKTGTRKWEFDYGTNMWVESSPYLNNGNIYIGSSGSKTIWELDGMTGKPISFFLHKAFFWSTPLIVNDILYIGGTDFKAARYTGMYAFRLSNGKILTDEKDMKLMVTEETLEPYQNWFGVAASPVLADGTIYYGGLDGKLYALAAE